MRGEASEPVVLANAAARVACGSLSMLFIFTMVAFTALRVFGLKRVLVPRSGIIGVGVAWTIAVSGIGMVGYGITIAGVVAYSEAKKRGKEAAAKRMGRGASSGVLELLGNEGEADRQRSGSKLSQMA